MKKQNLLLFLLFVLTTFTISAQVLESFAYNFNVEGKINKMFKNFKEGENVTILGMIRTNYVSGVASREIFIQSAKMEISNISYAEISKIDIRVKNCRDFWIDKVIKYDVIKSICDAGIQYKLRRELEEDALDYLGRLKSNDLIFKDDYLESYLYSLIYRLYPVSLNDGRPGILNVCVIKDSDPNAFVLPNGTMVLTTGILSVANSEEELLAIMAHEVSHFVLDHSVKNINKEIKRKNRADFWASLATGLAAVGDAYLATQSEYYTFGQLTYNTAILSSAISDQVTERLGLSYSRDQEREADECATLLMTYLSYRPQALSSVLLKLKNKSILNGNYFDVSGEGTHPAIDERVKSIGSPNGLEFKDDKYDVVISLVNTYNAYIQFNSKRFNSTIELADRNINKGIGIEDDLILKAKCLMALNSSKESNLRALAILKEARIKKVIPNIEIYKQEAIADIRLGNKLDAKKCLEEYLSNLNLVLKEFLDKGRTKNMEDLRGEIEWTNIMINKINAL